MVQKQLKASKIDDYMLRAVLAVVNKDAATRTLEEIQQLLPWLRKISPLLNSCTRETLEKLVRFSHHRRAQRDDVIIRQDEKGDSFFVILKRRTSVYIKAREIVSNIQQKECKASESVEEDVADEIKKRNAKLDRNVFGKFIITYEAGRSFGEIALLKNDALRNASIVADEETDLLVIDKDLFDFTLKGSQKKEFEERVDFVENHPIFGKWQSRSRRLLEMSLTKEVVAFDGVIVRQGAPVTGLHFLAKGQAKIVVDPKQHTAQYPKYFGLNHGKGDGKDQRKPSKKAATLHEAVQQEQVRVRRHEGYAAAERRLTLKAMTLCTIDVNEIIGDLELVLGLETYAQTVVATANSEVFVLDNRNIDRLIQKKSFLTADAFRLAVEVKLRNHVTLLTGLHIPLLPILLVKLQETNRRRQVALEQDKKVEDVKEPTLTEKIYDKELMMAQLTKLFVQGRTPLVEPSVPGDEPDRDHAVNRFLSQEATRQSRPQTAHAVLERDVTREDSTSDARYANVADSEDTQFYLDKDDVTQRRVRNIVLEMNDLGSAKNTERTKTIQQMLNKQTSASATHALLRPKTAPGVASQLSLDDDYAADDFDIEVGNDALSQLEGRIMAFHQKHELPKEQDTCLVTALRRFNIQTPDDVPIPGGTVYVRQRECSYPTGSKLNPALHQHVRRFIIPKDAYAIASRSLRSDSAQPQSVKDIRRPSRPKTAAVTRAATIA